MIRYVLDTDTLSLLQHGHPLISRKVAAATPGELALAVISIEEQFIGVVYARPTRKEV